MGVDLASRLLESVRTCPTEADMVAAVRDLLDHDAPPPGFRLPSIRSLSESSGLSRHEVYRALGTLVQEGRIERRHGSGTYVAEGAGEGLHTGARRPGQSLRIGVVPPLWDPRLSHHGVALILQGISMQVELGHHVQIVPPQVAEQPLSEFLAHLRSQHLDGVIWVQPAARLPVGLVRLVDAGMPVVVTGRPYAALPVPTVCFDSEAMAAEVSGLLAEQGRQKVLCLVGPRDDLYTKLQIDALRSALQTRGIALPERQIITVHLSPREALYSIDLRLSLSAFLERHADFDAVYSLYPDHLDLLSECCASRGPQSFDFTHVHFGSHNTLAGQVWPQLPTLFLEVPYQAMGQQAVKELEKLTGIARDSDPEDLAPRFARAPVSDLLGI